MRKRRGKRMKAYYFRYLNQNTARGTVHTASADGVKGAFCRCYMCSDGTPVRGEEISEERFRKFGDYISVLVLENLHDQDLKEVQRILREHHVGKVFLPYKDKAVGLKELELADTVQILESGQEVCFQERGWNVWLKCLENQDQGTLVMYHGPADEVKEKQDCVLTEKPFGRTLPCQVCVDAENHACGMRCCLYNDYTICKGHNAKGFEGYVTGALLLGNTDLSRYQEELKNSLEKYRSDIRLVTLPGHGMEKKNTETFLNFLCGANENLNRYYVLPEGTEDNEKVLKTVMAKGSRQIPVLTNEENGFCLSGFFTEKV